MQHSNTTNTKHAAADRVMALLRTHEENGEPLSGLKKTVPGVTVNAEVIQDIFTQMVSAWRDGSAGDLGQLLESFVEQTFPTLNTDERRNVITYLVFFLNDQFDIATEPGYLIMGYLKDSPVRSYPALMKDAGFKSVVRADLEAKGFSSPDIAAVLPMALDVYRAAYDYGYGNRHAPIAPGIPNAEFDNYVATLFERVGGEKEGDEALANYLRGALKRTATYTIEKAQAELKEFASAKVPVQEQARQPATKPKSGVVSVNEGIDLTRDEANRLRDILANVNFGDGDTLSVFRNEDGAQVLFNLK